MGGTREQEQKTPTGEENYRTLCFGDIATSRTRVREVKSAEEGGRRLLPTKGKFIGEGETPKKNIF